MVPFVFVCRPLNTAKYGASFYNCWKLSLKVFHVEGILIGFTRFAEKAPAVGFVFKWIFKRRLQRRRFSVDWPYFWKRLPFRAQTTVSVTFFILDMQNQAYAGVLFDMLLLFLLLLTAKQSKFFILLQKIISSSNENPLWANTYLFSRNL